MGFLEISGVVAIIIAALLGIVKAYFTIIGKKVPDETKVSMLLLQHQHNNYQNALTRIDDMERELREIRQTLLSYSAENLHARYLMGLGSDDPLPLTPQELVDHLIKLGRCAAISSPPSSASSLP